MVVKVGPTLAYAFLSNFSSYYFHETEITGRILAGIYSKGMVNFANGPNKFDLQYPNLVENKYFST